MSKMPIIENCQMEFECNEQWQELEHVLPELKICKKCNNYVSLGKNTDSFFLSVKDGVLVVPQTTLTTYENKTNLRVHAYDVPPTTIKSITSKFFKKISLDSILKNIVTGNISRKIAISEYQLLGIGNPINYLLKRITSRLISILIPKKAIDIELLEILKTIELASKNNPKSQIDLAKYIYQYEPAHGNAKRWIELAAVNLSGVNGHELIYSYAEDFRIHLIKIPTSSLEDCFWDRFGMNYEFEYALPLYLLAEKIGSHEASIAIAENIVHTLLRDFYRDRLFEHDKLLRADYKNRAFLKSKSYFNGSKDEFYSLYNKNHDLAISHLLKAKNHDGKAEYILGIIYQDPNYKKYNSERSFEFFKESAALGYAESYLELAKLWEISKNENYVEASLDWYKKYLNHTKHESSKKIVTIRRKIHLLLSQSKNTDEIYENLSELVKLGDLVAIHKLALINILNNEFSEAKKLLQFIDGDLNQNSIFLLIHIFLEEGQTQEAEDLLNSSNLEKKLFASKIGKQYFYKNNYQSAFNWISLGDTDPEASEMLGLMYLRGQGVKKDISKAFDYLTKSSNEGVHSSDDILGYLHEHGKGSAVNIPKAIELYSSALSIKKSKLAALGLGRIYESGVDVPRDIIKSIKYYETAKSWGSLDANMKLARFYSTGQGVDKSTDKAIELYKEVAFSGDLSAIREIGKLYLETGNLEHAYAWFNVGAASNQSNLSNLRDVCERRMTTDQIANAMSIIPEISRNISSVQA